MSLRPIINCCVGETLRHISMRSNDSSPRELGGTDSRQLAGVSAMSVLKRSAVGLKSVLNSGAWLFLIWMAWTVAQAGGVVVDATRTFTVGKTLLTVEHDMGVVFGLADKIAVVVYGEVIAFDTPEAVRANPKVQEAYLGSSVADSQAGGH